MLRFLRSPTVAATLAALAAAQSPLPPTRGLDRAHGVQADGAALRGGGADYRVRFERGAVEFTPALGRAARRVWPLRFTFDSARRGDRIAHRADAALAPEHDGDTVLFRRGSLTERYAVRADGVEQSFVFAHAVPGDGDLIVSGRLDTELELVEAEPDGLRFTAEGLGGVRIGAVTGIDAAGRRVAGALRLDAGRLELSLPGAFVDQASYPLVLDPLIGADFVVVSSASGDRAADAAYDESVGQWLIAWQRVFASNDAEICGQRMDINGNLVGGTIFLTAAGGHAIEPTVASVNLTNRYLVAWQQAPSLFGQYDILCAAVNLDGTFTAAVPIATTASDEVAPHAAGELTNADDEALVVWWDPGRVMGCQVTLPAGTGAPVPFDHTPLYVGTVGYGSPRISKSGGSFGRFLIVFDLRPWTAQIASLIYDRELTPLANVAAIATGSDVSGADVDGDSTFFHVAYERDNGATGRDIVCQKVRFDLTTPPHLDVSAAPVVLDADPGTERDPTVGFLGAKYTVAWVDETGFLTSQIKLRELSQSCTPCGQTAVIAGTRAYNERPQIATQWSNSAGSTDGALLLFGSAHNAPPFTSNVEAQLFEQFGGGPVTSLGGGCGTPGTAGASGPFAVGNPGFAFTLSGAGAASAAVMVLNGPVAPIVCGPCSITPPLQSFVRPVVAGNASLTMPLPCNLGLLGGTIEVQWWVPGTAASPCGLLPNVSFSNRLRATVAL